MSDEERLARRQAVESAAPVVCRTCDGLGGRKSGYAPGYARLPDGRLDGWTMGGKKDCPGCGGTGFESRGATCDAS